MTYRQSLVKFNHKKRFTYSAVGGITIRVTSHFVSEHQRYWTAVPLLIRQELIILGLHNRESFWPLNIISHAIQAVPPSQSQIFMELLSLSLTHTICFISAHVDFSGEWHALQLHRYVPRVRLRLWHMHSNDLTRLNKQKQNVANEQK